MNPDAKRFGRGTKFISVMDILNNQFICYDNIRASVEVVDGDIETYGVVLLFVEKVKVTIILCFFVIFWLHQLHEKR